MSRSAVDLESIKQKRDKPWKVKGPKDIPDDFDLARYVPPKACKLNNLRVWSRFVCKDSSQAPEQQDQIPLTTVDLRLQPEAESEYSVYKPSQHSSITSAASSRKPESLVFNIDFGDEKYVKKVDFATFARWDNVRTLLEGLEDEGATIDELWDLREHMPICGGDWEARVYPGMEIDARCRRPWDEDVHLNSDDTEDEALEERMRQADKPYVGHWWFGRWRMKVEQEAMRIGGAAQEPSRRMVLLGTIAMAAFLGVVIVFCAL